MKLTTWIAVLVLVFSLRTAQAENLVPPAQKRPLNYWCTWYAQNYWIGYGTDLQDTKLMTNERAREEINYQTVFDSRAGWATTYLPSHRQDFIFLIDHGWQTKDSKLRTAGGGAFYNMIAEPHDFPPYAKLTPQDRLKQFNQDIRKLGWDSLGLWVRGNIDPETVHTFVKWSKEAGIRYWKIDGGDTQAFHAWYAKQKLYPELVLEYITGSNGNINPGYTLDQSSYPSAYDIGGPKQQPMLSVLQHSDVFRTYDAAPLLMSSTTLRRTHDILKQTQQQPKYTAILNVQDDCNLAIGLGVLVASKRHPNFNQRTLRGKDLHHQLSGPRRMQYRMDEVARIGRWSRIAPAFPAGEGTYVSSENELIDRCQFTEYDTWNRGTYGKMISQSAPAVVARNMPLPTVESTGKLAPFVCATTYPNGPLGIATEGRVTPENKWIEPRAKVTVRVRDAAKPIGIVGRYENLTLHFAGDLDGVSHVWAQDLLAQEAIDIKQEVTITGNNIRLSGNLIDRIGTSAGSDGDLSAPGMVLRLAGTNLPIAGQEYLPKVKPVSTATRVLVPSSTKRTEYVDGYAGTAKLERSENAYIVSGDGITVKRLPKTIESGKSSFSWSMQAVGSTAFKRNGFLVLSADAAGESSLLAGSFIGASELNVFEITPNWGAGSPRKRTRLPRILACRLDLDMDARVATLFVGDEKLTLSFSERMTTVDYIGFGVKAGSKTKFSNPIISATATASHN